MYDHKLRQKNKTRECITGFCSVEASGYGQLFRVSFLLIPPFPPNSPSPEQQRSDLNLMARKV